MPSPAIEEAASGQATSAFAEGIRRIVEVVGRAHVVTEEPELDRRGRCLIPYTRRPSAFVHPGSVEEIQRIVAIANELKLTLWPASKGKNWGYGSATACSDGAIILLLERMDRIITIDEDLAYAVVEPGVTFRQLHQHLKASGSKLWLDCTDGPADGSVVGNALERGIGETPYGDHFQNICGIEAVLPQGELVRTGGGAIGNDHGWNTYKWGVGPYLEGLFSQSNLGIVTKMGVWLMPAPPAFVSCLFELRDEADLPRVVDALRRLQFSGAVQSKVHMINDVTTFGIILDDLDARLQGEPCLSDARRAAIRAEFNVAPWTFAAGIYGTAAQVRLAKAMVRKELGRLGRIQFMGRRTVALLERILPALTRWKKRGEKRWLWRGFERVFRKQLEVVEFLPHVHAIEQGAPSDYFVKHAYMKAKRPKPADHDIDPARDGCGGIWAGPIVPLEGSQVQRVVDLCFSLAREHRLDLNIALMVANPRSAIVLTSIFFDKSDAELTRRANDLYFAICRATQAAGYQQYRSSTAFMGEILTPAPAFQDLANRIKRTLDPNNILAPGKYGVG